MSDDQFSTATSRPESRVTVHMAASLDGFIARKDGSVDWMHAKDSFDGGENLDPEFVKTFLASIDCYVMGSKTYETALGYERQGLGWAYGDTPVVVLTGRELVPARPSVRFVSGDLGEVFEKQLRPRYANIWVAGGGSLVGECLRRGLADEVRYSIIPVLIGEGIGFFAGLDRDVALHLCEVKAYKNGIVALRHEVRAASG
jgi:dihydrofolate reductase